MTKRINWEFQYQVKELLKAAEAKLDFYKSRVNFWEEAKKTTIQKIKAEGIEVDDSLADRAGNDSKYSTIAGRGGHVAIRDDLQRDLYEAHEKIAKHKANVGLYDGWVEVLKAQPPEKTYELHQDDWLFFFSTRA